VNYFAPQQQAYCRMVVPASWRETPGPIWQFVASMLRNQKKVFQERPQSHPRSNGWNSLDGLSGDGVRD
jgi:hypothetical protein